MPHAKAYSPLLLSAAAHPRVVTLGGRKDGTLVSVDDDSDQRGSLYTSVAQTATFIAMLGVATLATPAMRIHSSRAASGETTVGSCAGSRSLTCSASHASP